MSLPSEGQSRSANPISSRYLSWRLRYNTSSFEIQTSAILEFYFRFRSRPFRRNWRVILYPAAEFRPNRNIRRWNMTSYWFSNGGRQPCCIICFGPPTKCFSWFEFWPQIASSSDQYFYRYCDINILAFCLESAYSRPFWRVFGEYFPHMTSPIVLTPKRHFLGRKQVIWAIQVSTLESVRLFDLGAWPRKKNSRPYNKKVKRVLYFPYLGGSPRLADSTLKLHGGWCRRRNHVCQVSNWNLHRLQF